MVVEADRSGLVKGKRERFFGPLRIKAWDIGVDGMGVRGNPEITTGKGNSTTFGHAERSRGFFAAGGKEPTISILNGQRPWQLGGRQTRAAAR